MDLCRNTVSVAGDGRIRSEEVAVRFGRNLFRCRRRAAMSQEGLGNLACLHRTEIGLLEHGTRLPRIDTLMKLAGSLGVEPDELLEGIQWTPGDGELGHFTVSDGSLGSLRAG